MIEIRRARRSDVAAIAQMLADDDIGAGRETPSRLEPYLAAFDAIDADPNQTLVVADEDGSAVGTLQLTVIPGMARTGSARGQIEGVRVHSSQRGTGLGTTLLEWAIEEARSRGCVLVQLTSDARRTDAHRFYERLGFAATHTGFKLQL
ncbi:GNAT family N-acetyltransferase [Amycolatopsis magusensis]|uniref:GNAT superfamily N-acetyltransferase n=1 Tax=Amycolatopsis magusensis TaxID=882444 RepID=A0ABS4Q523_9PSEU|nr:GNAT family N-acetyltransferase [Amycolatopsis magusensis]MBP2186764.1 GNAT superfamily N-acetyltransferase [Amycolatopsis magusensis]MDI5979066.1 GNAT family N-acetyltransferase [Amycolatopsis magusensis]